MKKLRLYLDTTVWNFAFADDAPDHRDETLEFFQMAKWDKFEIFDSETVAKEIEAAPEKRLRQIAGLMGEVKRTRLELNADIERLATVYLKRGALPKRSTADAFHVAYATYYGMDALLSWNFKHLANINRRNRLVAVNLEEGYGQSLQIVTPLEVSDDEKPSRT